MKAYIQSLETMRFLKKDGGWTVDINEAHICSSAVDALEVCITRRLATVQIVLRFTNGDPCDEMNIRLENGNKGNSNKEGARGE